MIPIGIICGFWATWAVMLWLIFIRPNLKSDPPPPKQTYAVISLQGGIYLEVPVLEVTVDLDDDGVPEITWYGEGYDHRILFIDKHSVTAVERIVK